MGGELIRLSGHVAVYLCVLFIYRTEEETDKVGGLFGRRLGRRLGRCLGRCFGGCFGRCLRIWRASLGGRRPLAAIFAARFAAFAALFLAPTLVCRIRNSRIALLPAELEDLPRCELMVARGV